jgi:ATP-dependent Zn protease
LKSMRKTFKEARDHAPSLLFIDEVDSFPNRATIDHYNAEWHIQVVNALLAEIDGVEGREGVVLLAACNFPEKLDPALIRSGRLSRHIHIGSPSRSSLAAIFREHLGNELEVENLSSAALAAAGSTGADVERFVAGARRRARDAGRAIILADLVAEIGGGDDRTATELWIAAIHESGHAVAYCELAPGTLQAITLRHSAESGGMTSASFSKAYISAADVRRQLVAMLAGRAAEDVILKIPSSACGGNATSDLAVATRLAAASATSLGLDHVSGLVWMGVPDTTTLPRMLSNSPALAARVHLIVDQAYQEAVTLIRRRSAAVKAVAAALLDRRGLDGGEVAAIVAQHPSRGMKAIHEPQS